MAQCRKVVDEEGLVIEGRCGTRVAHPLLKIEAAARAAYLAAMRGLRLEPPGRPK
jgi:hypothetical protein